MGDEVKNVEVTLDPSKVAASGGPVCIAQLSVLMLVLPDGRTQAKIEHWAADDLALDLLKQTLAGVPRFLDERRPSRIIRPVGVLPGLPRGD